MNKEKTNIAARRARRATFLRIFDFEPSLNDDIDTPAMASPGVAPLDVDELRINFSPAPDPLRPE
jgi:hypothetical protein